MILRNPNWNMSLIHYQIHQRDVFSTYPPPIFPSPKSIRSTTPPSPGPRISPAVLFIIVILAVLFFISGFLHLLVRFLVKQPDSPASSSRYPEISTSEALQRQLQQLFHLHDSGLDQAFIDALPVFNYKEIVGINEPFDCAVCLCEFTEKDKLRLLPVCSHAFHISCIGTWLLSNSTCPLCRGTLFSQGISIENPIFDYEDLIEEDDGGSGLTTRQKVIEIEEAFVVEKRVLPVRLGKFRKWNNEGSELAGETSSSNLDARRCFSMGSYQYVVVNSDLRVPYDDSKPAKRAENQNWVSAEVEGKKITSVTKGESFSVSKIWQWSKRGKLGRQEHQQMGYEQLDVSTTQNNSIMQHILSRIY